MFGQINRTGPNMFSSNNFRNRDNRDINITPEESLFGNNRNANSFFNNQYRF